MQVALLTTFVVNKKEPLAELLERIHAAFLASGLEPPAILFTFSDRPVPGGVSAVDRLVKKHPEFGRFTGARSPLPDAPPVRHVSNLPDSPGAGHSIAFPALLAAAAGVPKSLPFHSVSIHFHSPAFGVQFPHPHVPPTEPALMLTHSWSVTARD